MLPLLYIVRMDVEPDYLDEFVKWYDTRHGPDLIDAGFHSCNAYHCVDGEPLICNVYEVPSLSVFSSPEYESVRENDVQLMEEVLHKISNHSNTVYEQKAMIGVPPEAASPDTKPSRSGAVCAPVVSTVRFDAEGESGPIDWFQSKESALLMEQQDFLRARLSRQCGKHPMFPSSQPDWFVLMEWASLDAARAHASHAETVERYRQIEGVRAETVQYNVAGLSATLLNTNNWVR